MRLPKLPPPPKLRSPSPLPLPHPTPPRYLEELLSLQVVLFLEELLPQAPLFSAPPLRHLSNQQAISSQHLPLLFSPRQQRRRRRTSSRNQPTPPPPLASLASP